MRESWDALSGGVVFRSFDWLESWWRHYGEGDPRRELCIVLVSQREEEGRVVAIAPWYRERSLARGSVLRWLGSGEVCSDHLTLLTDKPASADAIAGAIAGAIADHLVDRKDWDQLQLEGVDQGDTLVESLAASLLARECAVRERVAGNCWAIDLPTDWEAFLAMQSKSHRKQLRQADQRVLSSDRAVWHLVTTTEEFIQGWEVLVHLHQRRRQSLGEPGCFASRRFTKFHREVAQRLLATGRLRLSWLELDGTPAAAEYHFAGTDTTYAYQGGVDPERLTEEPGRLSNIATLQQAIAEGHQSFDFLRGDEPYKAHWRATPRGTIDWRIAAPRHAARWRLRSLDWAGGLANAVRTSLRGGAEGSTTGKGV